ncbi:DNA-methyltransferase [Mesorhizobium sp. NZP2298]|uniref:DNA-methyltransferase n=1 Tax=Mesorhizobium sp. NZP2298 TaxID=2483403 RepID=UPI0015538183|nr:site-specific DNA-methyltransferase [Mesorhizobium sp. NZP2298]QKC99201.1 site-specific DNA-methyltransferase [Mesorhizobium sp. NZP2298]
MRVETIGDCTLYNGDMRDIVPTLSSVDCIVSDAPYLVSKGGFAANLQLEGGFGGWMKDYGNGGDIVKCDIKWSDWLPIVYAALKDDRQAYFMSNGKNLKAAWAAAEAAGFDLHTILTWDKRSALPNKYYQNVTEFTLFMRKGKAFTIRNPASKSLVSIFQRDESSHPTEKPTELMSLYIENSTWSDWVVLDPFMGSGTTGVSCVQSGRPFIGIELDETYFDMSCRRIEAASRKPNMFRPKNDNTPPADMFAPATPVAGAA